MHSRPARGEPGRRRGSRVDAPWQHLWLTPPERLLRRYWWPLAGLMSVLLLLNEWMLFGSDPSEWDWLLVTGALLFFALYPASLGLPDRAQQCVEQLVRGQALVHDQRPVEEAWPVALRLHVRALRWAGACAAVSTVLMLIVWTWAYGARWWTAPTLAVLEIVGAALAGLFIGRAIGYGRMGRILAAGEVEIRARPGHPDGAAGLRPVGALFLFQASLFAAIAIYIGVWWLLIPRFPAYSEWRDAYVFLMVAVVLFSFLAFFLPLLWFHARMGEQKQALLEAADRAAAEAIGLRDAALSADSVEARRSAESRVDLEVRRYTEIQAMPTWPIDRWVRRRFAYNQVLVFVPLALKGLSADWQEFGNTLTQWLLGGE